MLICTQSVNVALELCKRKYVWHNSDWPMKQVRFGNLHLGWVLWDVIVLEELWEFCVSVYYSSHDNAFLMSELMSCPISTLVPWVVSQHHKIGITGVHHETAQWIDLVLSLWCWKCGASSTSKNLNRHGDIGPSSSEIPIQGFRYLKLQSLKGMVCVSVNWRLYEPL